MHQAVCPRDRGRKGSIESSTGSAGIVALAPLADFGRRRQHISLGYLCAIVTAVSAGTMLIDSQSQTDDSAVQSDAQGAQPAHDGGQEDKCAFQRVLRHVEQHPLCSGEGGQVRC